MQIFFKYTENIKYSFFLSFSPRGLEEVGYFILIMAAAAAACEPKDQFSDQKEKHKKAI